MPSPDLTQYNPLLLFDRDPHDLSTRALADAAAKLPGWTPREGNTEVVLIEALALIVAELVYAVNRVPDATVEILMRLYGITRDLGLPATATVRFTLGDTLGHTVPAGTRVTLDVGTTTVVFATDTPATAAPGSGTVDATVTAQSNTAAANGIAIGTAVSVIDSAAFVDSAAIQGSPTGGRDPESTQDWLSRGVQTFSRLVDTLVLPDHFTAEAMLNDAVYRATTIDNWDPTAGGGAGAAANGHVTVAVLGQNGSLLSGPTKTAIQADLAAKAQANLAVHVVDPTITTIAVTATVVAKAGWDHPTVQANVTAALEAYLSTDTWDWSPEVRINALIAQIGSAAGVAYVSSITVPAADVPLSGVAPLAGSGVITITVT